MKHYIVMGRRGGFAYVIEQFDSQREAIKYARRIAKGAQPQFRTHVLELKSTYKPLSATKAQTPSQRGLELAN